MAKSGNYRGASAVLVTMHAKERVIGPVLKDGLELDVHVARDIDTDVFGTFSGEIARQGSQLDAARAKIHAGFAHLPDARVGIASEGSFGPHPSLPFMAVGHEVVMMIDRLAGLEIIGHDTSTHTNFASGVARDLESAFAFAERAKFPGHGLIVMGCRDERPAPEILLAKNIADRESLAAEVREAIQRSGAAFLETDMRAHRNPTRMEAIERAAHDLVRRFRSCCPRCDHPGFGVSAHIPGLPCSECGAPTRVTLRQLLSCRSCGHECELAVGEGSMADPGQCDHCNP